ncbi:MAG: ParB/RepB/Spo0J family partition protein [Flavobacteriaceae bacterium]|nr:ParB/RepB/Spo0J family partition protein [Flavobacteriaceae bacterium]MBL6683873.1 ParB/RepB/Spo0J family partition protein [Flavobacteriaceae bacterium]
MAKAYKKRVLGRGLSAILSDDDNNRFEISKKSYLLNEIEIDKISLNPNQPRTNFNKKSLDELASSINELGLIQPVTVQKIDENFILISGERRLRAFKQLNKKHIPAYIRTADDQTSLEMALVENIQRRDLDPIEIAITYHRLTSELKISHDEMSKRVGKDRTTITNYIRLLKLDPVIQSGIRDKFISMGHGRALINIENQDDQLLIYEKILKNNLSVRDTEKLVRNSNSNKSKNNIKIITDEIKKEFSKIEIKTGLNLSLKLSKDKAHIIFKFESDKEIIENLKKFND